MGVIVFGLINTTPLYAIFEERLPEFYRVVTSKANGKILIFFPFVFAGKEHLAVQHNNAKQQDDSDEEVVCHRDSLGGYHYPFCT